MVTVLFVVAAIINFVPVVGVASAARLESMYSVTIGSPDLALMMRHRAVLLAIVGGLLFVAALRQDLRPAAAVAGFASMLSFLALAWGEPAANAALRKVAAVDIVGVVVLAAAVALDQR